jgi:hypothetical protein
MNTNSCRFLGEKWIFIVFAIMAFLLAPCEPWVLAEEQTDSPVVVPANEAVGSEHAISAPAGFMAPTLDGPWRFRIALNAWMLTDLKITADTASASGSVEKDLGWVIDHIDYILPIDGEVRKGSFGAYAHLFAFKLTGDLQAGPAQIDWNDHGSLLDVGLSYELGRWALGKGARTPSLTVEPFVGARVLHDPVDLDVNLSPGGGSKRISLSNEVPVIGLRTFWDLTEHWNLHIEGDYGGFGVDDNDETWNLLGLIGYRFRGWGLGWNIQAGYRALRLFDFKKNGADLRADLKGPIVVFATEF